MVGGSQRRVNSLYQRARPAAPAADEDPSEGRRRRRSSRRRDPSPPAPAREECEQVTPEDEDEEEEEEEEEDEEEATGGGSATSGGSGIYLRGPASLPQRPIPPHRRPLIRPDVEKSWTIVQSAGCHTRQVNGILGLLCKEHFPGFVQYAGVTTPAYTFDHYVAADDARDRDGRQFDNKAERVKAELWDFFRCQEGMEERAALVATKVCKKLVKDMHYEARIQAVITYHGVFLGTKVTKAEARTMTLTQQQYLEAQLEEEKRRREELEMRMVTEREALEARMAAERVALEARMAAEREAEQRRLVEILQYMQSLGAAQGMPPPPGLFAPPPPPDAATPNQSAASNEVPHASNPSPNQSRWP